MLVGKNSCYEDRDQLAALIGAHLKFIVGPQFELAVPTILIDRDSLNSLA
jgi:hypothetical protein